jgi:RNA polymerase sigma factor (sigma-70 family)
MTEQDLIKSCLRNDRRAQRELYDRFAPAMYAICVRYTRKPENARDVLQDGFIKVFSGLKNFRSDGSFEGWMKRIFIHTAINHYHKLKSEATHITPESDYIDPKDQSANALDKLSEKELLQLIAALPDGYRMVFNLFVIEGYSHDEIAELLNIKSSTSRSQLVKARMLLQQRIHSQNIFVA